MTPPMNFIAPKEESSYIKVIGVGGGGVNAVNHMCRQGIVGVDFIVCNTDSKSLSSSPVISKLQLGEGLGAGGRPEVAMEYAQEAKDRIKEALAGTRMLFITAGMGGGTGTGASPVIAEIAKEIETNDPHMPEVLVVAIVTMPFRFEGKARLEQAQAGLEQLRSKVDSIIIIDNNKVFVGERIKFSQCFAKADDVLLTAAKSVAEMITVNSYMDVDLRDVNSVMSKSGTAIMGAGIASGENRAIEAVEEAMRSPLLNDIDITDSQKILLHITCSQEYEADNDEIEEITEKITTTCKNSPNLKMGIGFDDSLGESLRVILVATGFQAKPTKPETSKVIDWESIKGGSSKVFHRLDEQKTTAAPEPTPEFVQHPKVEQQTITVQQPVSVAAESEKETRVVHFLDSEPVMEEPVAEVQAKPQQETAIDPIFTVTSKNESAPFQEQQQPEPVAVQQPQRQPEAVAPQAQQEFVAPTPTVVETPADMEQRNATRELVFSRMANIKNLKEKYSTQAGFTEMEDVPSFARQGIQTSSTPDAAESEANKTVVGKDGQLSPNSFVFTSVD